MRDLRTALVQGNTVWHDAAANREYYGSLVRPLKGKVDLVVLPETFTSGFSNEAVKNAETMHDESVAWLLAIAGEIDAAVVGSMAVRDGERVFNRLLWATPQGLEGVYDKRHLFRMAGEHKRYAAGKDRLIVEWRDWRICPMVCYDLRFPVFSRNLQGDDGRMDFDLLLYVANWPQPRRTAWRVLLRARAVENLCYVIGVNRAGLDGNGIEYAGDSAAIDFLGEPLRELDSAAQVGLADLDGATLAMHRARFPAWMDADRFELIDDSPA